MNRFRPLTRLLQIKIRDFKTTKLCVSTQSSLLKLSVDQSLGSAIIHLKNRPINGITGPLILELLAVLDSLHEQDNVTGVVITSDIPRIFSAGLDLTQFYGAPDDYLHSFWTDFQSLILSLLTSRLVVIAAINGQCPAGGTVLAMACDYRIMLDNPDFEIGLNEIQIGCAYIPEWVKDLYVRILGYRKAERALQFGHMFNPQTACESGLVDELANAKELMSKSHDRLRDWSGLPVDARHSAKLLLRQPMIDYFKSKGEADRKLFVDFVKDEKTQMFLRFLCKKPNQTQPNV